MPAFDAAKKVQVIWGAQRTNDQRPARRKIVMRIDEARQTGARLEPACEVVGISSRTYQSWSGKFLLFSGTQTRSYLHSKDVCAKVLFILLLLFILVTKSAL